MANIDPQPPVFIMVSNLTDFQPPVVNVGVEKK